MMASGGGGRGEGAEKEERRELENDEAMRSILERLRDHRDATGVPLLLDDESGAERAAVEGDAGCEESWCWCSLIERRVGLGGEREHACCEIQGRDRSLSENHVG
jgi:hypothetical protein